MPPKSWEPVVFKQNLDPDRLLESLIQINKGVLAFPKANEYIEELTATETKNLQLYRRI